MDDLINRNLCDSCINNGCIFQSRIIRNHCDFYKAIEAIDDLPNCYNGYSDTYDKAFIIGVLEEQPTIDPVKHGRWIMQGTAYGCSLCGEGVIHPFHNYCPNCGARMEQ